ncbi:hypothetical protein [Desulforamulus aeronauticus]|uniref:Uncharacterized protein n=1 Tax=Desulforamulus aeronauticus DSM 10349 TaxID=1121421 RepID=A0A1M6UAF6_9FIRM|nr:hypothetical protein [Desulforamulus aeronauticus]SHK66153.1 hypothetical protein SAMN02745123_02675 [Desulforamulus aeronauticus DSM 10349]
MLASWVWGLVTLFFLIGIKKYRPAKSTLPVLLMAWSSVLFLVSLVLYSDRLTFDSGGLSWEPMLLATAAFLFCLPLYSRYRQLVLLQKKNKKQSKARAC